MTKTKLSLITLVAASAALPAIASADHVRVDTRARGAWSLVGEVGTHRHDAEDYVPVANQRFDRIELRASGADVRLGDVKFQFADGHIEAVGVGGTLCDGQSIVLDVPGDQPLKMLVLDYDNRGPFYRGREESHVQVSGQLTRVRPTYPAYQPAPVYQPPVYQPAYGSVRDRRTQPAPSPSFVIRGGVRVRASF